MTESTARIAVVGAGLIGRRHVEAMATVKEVSLAAIVDPDGAARDLARDLGAQWFATLDEMFDRVDADGAIIATPNHMHFDGAIACLNHGLPVLVEKPLADTVANGAAILDAAGQAGLPVLVGHHRRYNPLMTRAREIVQSGDLGQLTAVQAQTWFRKPDPYFETKWRQKKGAGPVYLNLIHDIDLLQFLCGPVKSVQAMESNLVRGHEVEETAVVLLRFASGLLGTVNVSDAASAPWSWEMTARENPAYPSTSENCYWIGGTRGSLALPNLAVWRHEGGESWWKPIGATRQVFGFDDPLPRQIRHFGEVIRGAAKPLVTGQDGLSALKVIEAIKRSAHTGQAVAP